MMSLRCCKIFFLNLFFADLLVPSSTVQQEPFSSQDTPKRESYIMRSEVGQTETEKEYQEILKCRYASPSVISLVKKCFKPKDNRFLRLMQYL